MEENKNEDNFQTVKSTNEKRGCILDNEKTMQEILEYAQQIIMGNLK